MEQMLLLTVIVALLISNLNQVSSPPPCEEIANNTLNCRSCNSGYQLGLRCAGEQILAIESEGWEGGVLLS